ncbi:hypothetical protein AGR1B_Lc30042 [Agrobacterium fabacearum S56]|nr:hypothetical protein AGR1B_Lc30042 [Agrobacterium fabacearum S56]
MQQAPRLPTSPSPTGKRKPLPPSGPSFSIPAIDATAPAHALNIHDPAADPVDEKPVIVRFRGIGGNRPSDATT